MNVYDTANKLAQEIKQSEEYATYKMAKEAKSNNKDVKNKKHFWKDFKAELKKVIWPSPKQLSSKTFAVIVIVLITAAIVFILDLAFDIVPGSHKYCHKCGYKMNKVVIIVDSTCDLPKDLIEKNKEVILEVISLNLTVTLAKQVV